MGFGQNDGDDVVVKALANKTDDIKQDGSEAITYTESDDRRRLDVAASLVEFPVKGVPIALDPHNTDAFGRQRVSEPRNEFTYEFVYDQDFDIYWSTETASGGTITHDSTASKRRLSIAANSSSRAAMVTRRRMPYEPGKSHIFYFTGIINGLQANVQKRYGLFNTNNGVFFETDGLTLNVVIRSDSSGSIVNTQIPSTSWNIDKLDGNGPSGFNAADDPNFDKITLYWIDFAWLGAGFVRYGFCYRQQFWPLHVEYISAEKTAVWSKSAMLPFCAEIEADGTPAAADHLDIVCSSFQTEGSPKQQRRVRDANRGTSEQNYTSGTERLLMALRLKSGIDYGTLRLRRFEILNEDQGKYLLWRVRFNPSISGSPSWTDQPSSAAQAVTSGNNTVSGGLVLASGYINVKETKDTFLPLDLESDIFIGRDISGDSDEIVVTVQPIDNSVKLWGAMDWEEIY